MPVSFTDKPVTICTCLYGDYPALARRVIGSVLAYCDPSQYYLRVGCNTISEETMEFVLSLGDEIDDIYISNHNLNKDPMHKRMLCDMETKYHLWLDDDSAIESDETLPRYIETAESSEQDVALWGQLCYVDSMFDHVEQYDEEGRRAEMVEKVYSWIRNQKWYKGGQIPSGILRLGDAPDGYVRHELIHGCAYFARTDVLRDVLDWPAPGMSKLLGDVLLSEAVKQAGYAIQGMEDPGFVLGSCVRRGDGEDYGAFRHLFG